MVKHRTQIHKIYQHGGAVNFFVNDVKSDATNESELLAELLGDRFTETWLSREYVDENIYHCAIQADSYEYLESLIEEYPDLVEETM